MKINNPKLVEKLITYQLKAKDVLAKAFINQKYKIQKSENDIIVLSKAVLIADKKIKEQDNIIKRLSPKSEAYDLFLNSKNYMSLNKTAKGLKRSRNKMMQFLRNNGILFRDGNDNIPYQKYINSGYFTIDYVVGHDGQNHATTRVSPRGIEYIHKLYLKQEV